MASMQQVYGIQSQLAQCCCDNRAATQDLKFTLATEACATRAANGDNTQKILDKLCQLELDNERAQRAADQREIARLNSELMYARGQASQIEQTARIEASNAATVDSLYNRLKNCPVNAVPVAGNTPLFSCNPGFNSGCGCGGFGFNAA